MEKNTKTLQYEKEVGNKRIKKTFVIEQRTYVNITFP